MDGNDAVFRGEGESECIDITLEHIDPSLDSTLILGEETRKIIGCAFEVYNNLGSGFLEEVYQEALELEFQENGIPYLHKPSMHVYYKSHMLTAYYQPDILCYSNSIILELKATNALTKRDGQQLLNYLKGTGVEVGLLLNFGKKGKLEYRRVVYTNKKYIRNVSVFSDRILKNGVESPHNTGKSEHG